LVVVALLVIAAVLAAMYFYVNAGEDKITSPRELKELKTRAIPDETANRKPSELPPLIKEVPPSPVETASEEPAAKPEESVDKPKEPIPSAKEPVVRRKKKRMIKPITPEETKETTESEEEPKQFQLKFVPSQ
jgi:outer membrane biosynthesis protein TonB